MRLKGYDYSLPGAYFVTICAQDRTRLFGVLVGGEMVLNPAGQMVSGVWLQIPEHDRGTGVDAFVVMPNHMHGIISIMDAGREQGDGNDGRPRGAAPTVSLPGIIDRFKSLTTRRYSDGVNHLGWQPFAGRLWQRGYYERIIRNERELYAVREYILSNPANWEKDGEFIA